ncbi:hypothetical protein HYALB_00002821 [Hymenoscyphus albidus]|uniref:Glutathione S-transferase II n=1 Tax=Hymenoscyphus albidus TaxID=595503 RepID=A0A9N9LJ20_9HELO|nr:hypothetical protein HYALB_00002821 [Hymenoscyphus albidus]
MFNPSRPLQRFSHLHHHLKPKHTPKIPSPVLKRTMSIPSRPTGLIATSGIELLTFGTPNGHKISILLEELKAQYNKPYTVQSINIMENIQKEPWFTAFSPNGRIPAIVDHDRNGFSVFEGAAILAYLTRHYDGDYVFHFKDGDEKSRVEQWVAWQHGGLGPMQGQANHFLRFTKEKIQYPIQRYVGETERLYGILNTQLASRDYLVGPGRGKYSIADIASFSWVNFSYMSGITLSTQFPHVHRWWKSINDRPAVQAGLAVPSLGNFHNAPHEKRLESEEDFKEAEAKVKEVLEEAKKAYGYKFSSP